MRLLIIPYWWNGQLERYVNISLRLSSPCFPSLHPPFSPPSPFCNFNTFSCSLRATIGFQCPDLIGEEPSSLSSSLSSSPSHLIPLNDNYHRHRPDQHRHHRHDLDAAAPPAPHADADADDHFDASLLQKYCM